MCVKKIVLMCSLAFLLLGSGIAIGSSLNGDYNGHPIVKVTSGGKTLTDEIPAHIIDGKTMVPLTMLRQLGAQVTWNETDYSVDVKIPEKVKIVHPSLTQEQIKKIAESVYEIYGSISDDPTKASQGSGFILNGTMISNAHVAGNSAYTQVQIDGQWQKITNYTFVNNTTDVMGFKVSGGTSLPYSTVLPQNGDVCYAIGFPNGKLTITEGTILNITKVSGVNKIIHTATTEHGSSGGILLDDIGKIIGVTSSTVTGTNVNEAIPMIYIQQELDKLK